MPKIIKFGADLTKFLLLKGESFLAHAVHSRFCLLTLLNLLGATQITVIYRDII